MQDPPTTVELLTAVGEFLRNEAAPALAGRNAFLARVSANVIDIVAREITLAAPAAEAERARLHGLLSRAAITTDDDTPLAALNDALCTAIRDGRIDTGTPGLADHLWQTTLAKLAIDQPSYASYKAERDRGGPPPAPATEHP